MKALSETDQDVVVGGSVTSILGSAAGGADGCAIGGAVVGGLVRAGMASTPAAPASKFIGALVAVKVASNCRNPTTGPGFPTGQRWPSRRGGGGGHSKSSLFWNKPNWATD